MTFDTWLEERGLLADADEGRLSERALGQLEADWRRDEERADRAYLWERIRAVCPEALREFAAKIFAAGGVEVKSTEGERALRRCSTFEEFRAALRAENRRRQEHESCSGLPTLKQVDDDVLIRALSGVAAVTSTPTATESGSKRPAPASAARVADLPDDVAVRALGG